MAENDALNKGMGREEKRSRDRGNRKRQREFVSAATTISRSRESEPYRSEGTSGSYAVGRSTPQAFR